MLVLLKAWVNCGVLPVILALIANPGALAESLDAKEAVREVKDGELE
jgi:hypothetical protein